MTGEVNGWPIVFSDAAPRPGAVVIDPGALHETSPGVIVMHPDEEPHLWAAEGQYARAFLVLRRILNNRARKQAHAATKRIQEMYRDRD